MWDLIVSVPNHCLSFYFALVIFPMAIWSRAKIVYQQFASVVSVEN